ESQINGGNEPDERLPEELAPRRHALWIAIDDFLVVVSPTDPSKPESDQQHHPHETAGPVGPQQGTDRDGDKDQGAAHGGSAVFLQMRFRTITPHSLTDLQFGQLAYDPGACDQADQQGRTAGKHGAKRNVFEDSESPYMRIG